jgi:hypothetical protein
MRRKKLPLEKMQMEDPEAKGKVSLVLQVLSGEKTIAEACKETGLKPLQDYKIEDRMVQGMLQAAKLFRRGARKTRKNGPGRPKGPSPMETPTEPAEAPRRPGRPPQHPTGTGSQEKRSWRGSRCPHGGRGNSPRSGGGSRW